MGARPLEQQLFQLWELFIGQAETAANGNGIESAGRFSLAKPMMERDPMHAEGFGDGGRRHAFGANGRHGEFAKAFELRRLCLWFS